jgi:hypothetical protein
VTAATIGGAAQLLAAASPMMVQPKINVTISQVSGWRIFDRKRRIDARQRGQQRRQTRGGTGPRNNTPITANDDDANNHDTAASSYRGGVGGRYKDDAKYYNGNEDWGECEIWLSRSLKEMDLWMVWYMELTEKQCCGGGNENHDRGEALDGPRKLVYFKDKGGVEEDKWKEEGCPPSLVRSVLLSVDNDGYFGNKDKDVSHHWATSSMPSWPPPILPPQPPHLHPADLLMSSLTTQEVATTNGNGVAGTFFLPTVAGCAASSSVHLNNDRGYLFTPSHATMGGLGGEEDEGGGQDCDRGRRTEG